MTGRAGFIANDVSVEIANAFLPKSARLDSMYDVIASAAQGAIVDASKLLKERGRANIAAAGFGTRWQNAWRVEVYPKRGTSINAATYGHHNILYSAIFENGGIIAGRSGLLWIPIGKLPKIGRFRATPRTLINSGVKLFTMHNAHGGRPLLAVNVRVSKGQSTQDNLSVSLSKLRAGTGGKRGVVRAIPLFFGVPTVTLRKRFNISGIAAQITGQLGSLYTANLKTGG